MHDLPLIWQFSAKIKKDTNYFSSWLTIGWTFKLQLRISESHLEPPISGSDSPQPQVKTYFFTGGVVGAVWLFNPITVGQLIVFFWTSPLWVSSLGQSNTICLNCSRWRLAASTSFVLPAGGTWRGTQLDFTVLIVLWDEVSGLMWVSCLSVGWVEYWTYISDTHLGWVMSQSKAIAYRGSITTFIIFTI